MSHVIGARAEQRVAACRIHTHIKHAPEFVALLAWPSQRWICSAQCTEHPLSSGSGCESIRLWYVVQHHDVISKQVTGFTAGVGGWPIQSSEARLAGSASPARDRCGWPGERSWGCACWCACHAAVLVGPVPVLAPCGPNVISFF